MTAKTRSGEPSTVTAIPPTLPHVNVEGEANAYDSLEAGGWEVVFNGMTGMTLLDLPLPSSTNKTFAVLYIIKILNGLPYMIICVELWKTREN